MAVIITRPYDVDAGAAATYAVDVAGNGHSFTTHNAEVVFAVGTNKSTVTRTSNASFTFTVPLSWLPNSTMGTLKITAKAVSKSSGLPGPVTTASVGVYVPTSVLPTANSPALARVDGTVPSAWGVYVQGKSKVTVAVSGAGAQGSTIKKVAAAIDGVTKTATAASGSFTFDLPTAGTRTVTARVIDSRGREKTATTTLTVIAYAPPTLTSPSAWRANSGGTRADNGLYGAFKALAGFASVSGKNSISYASSYKEIPSGATVNIGTWVSNTNKVFGSGGLATTKSYLVTITITDQLGVAKSWSGVVPSERVPISFLAGGNGVAIGKAATTANWLEIALGTRIQDGTVTHEITGAGIHSASPTGDQPFHQVSTSTDVEPSFRLRRNNTNYGRLFQTITGGQDALALEAGDRSTATPGRLYLRADGRALIVPPDGVWRYLPWGAWAGRFSMTGLTQNNIGTLAITFPENVFSVPVVVPSVDTGSPQSVVCSANNISASGCNLNVRRSDTVSTATVHVIVMQYAP